MMDHSEYIRYNSGVDAVYGMEFTIKPGLIDVSYFAVRVGDRIVLADDLPKTMSDDLVRSAVEWMFMNPTNTEFSEADSEFFLGERIGDKCLAQDREKGLDVTEAITLREELVAASQR